MPLNRGGLGTIAWHACRGLQEAGLLRKVFAPEVGAAGPLQPLAQGMPWPLRKGLAVVNRLGWFGCHDRFFDEWVARRLATGDHYFGWMHQSLACIRRCHRWNGKAGIDRGSVEPQLQERWLQEEYKKFFLKSAPVSTASIQRMRQEAEEADWIMVPSSLVAESYFEAGCDRRKVRINPLGVDLPSSAPSREKRKEDGFRFVFVGQLSLQKGVPMLLEAWNHLAPSKAELVLAGIIPSAEREIIQPLLERSPQTTWNGHCNDVPSLLDRCDVLVLPSAQDGFGMVVLEAMAHSLPVIVSDRVGAKDCVTEAESGFIFPFGDQRALEERLEWFITDRSRAGFMRQRARADAERYSWHEYGKRFADLIQPH
jgi:glycosyltransferase involved in cell wall biosynthesis